MSCVLVWGAPGSGQTTYFAALSQAAFARSASIKRCEVHGLDDDSRAFLTDQGERLRNGYFPAPTRQTRPLRIRIAGCHQGHRFDFTFTTADLMSTSGTGWELPDLQNCTRLVYLHDLTNPHTGRAVSLMIDELSSRHRDGRRLYLAVCVAKFDDPRVFGQANEFLLTDNDRDRDLLEDDPMPTDAKRFFESVADPYVVDRIRGYFPADRIRYFACSAVGLLRDVNGRIDLRDYPNVRRVASELKLLSAGRPINVVEPLIWLHHPDRY